MRPDESPVAEIDPSIVYGGFRYTPTSTSSVTRIQEIETKDELKKPSGEIKKYIKSTETFVPKAYWDFKQYSIGYGTKANSKDEVIDEKEANVRFEEHVQESFDIVLKFAKKHNYKFTQNQADALTSFVYNLGPGSLKQVTNNGKRTIEEIQNAILLYNKVRSSKTNELEELEGLTKRRQAEVQFFNEGKIAQEKIKPTSPPIQKDVPNKINESSKQNIDSKRQASRNNVVIVQQNNNTTVVNQRTVARPVSPQTNNNPGLRQ